MFLLSYSMPWSCSHSQFILFWILGSLLIVAALLKLFACCGLISLLFSRFHCLTLCMMYALFVIHLIYTELLYLMFIACYFNWFIVAMRNLPTKWTLQLASHLRTCSVIMSSLPFTSYLKTTNENFQKILFSMQFFSQLYT
jgi:hypothetical protein